MKKQQLIGLDKYSGSALLSAFLLAGCGGGGSSTTANNTATGQSSVLTAARSAAPAAYCSSGGISVDAGIDSNNNKVLDASEVTSTQYVCNGGNGLSTLVLITSEAAGANCSSGGKKLSAGLDANGNGVLEAVEVTASDYVCNGVNGSSGASALNSLVSIVPEPAGSFCTYGGNKVSNGVDNNANGILDQAEISASNFVCNGAPGATGPAGAGITWLNVTGTSMQAQANTGYMADNAARVTITLPVAASRGDVVQVTGIGTGGWKIAQNLGQSIIFKGSAGQIWKAHDSTRSWRAIASSADGRKLVAAVYGGQLYTSTDYGATWTARESARNWTSVTSSADGSRLVATAELGGGQYIYISVDSGVTWSASGIQSNWASVASSSDGSKLVAGLQGSTFGSFIYQSADFGATWSLMPQTGQPISSVASSADGSKLVVLGWDPMGGTSKQLYTSFDYGATWNLGRIFTGHAFTGGAIADTAIASSSDGTKLVVAINGGQLYTSSDSGVTWTARESIRNWTSVALSSDGNKVVATANSGQIYTSTDSGLSWIPRETDRAWSAVAMSADGGLLISAIDGGQLFTSYQGTTTGITGSISGEQFESVDLQCIDVNTFVVRGYTGGLVLQ